MNFTIEQPPETIGGFVGDRYSIVALPYLYDQIRVQVWDYKRWGDERAETPVVLFQQF